MEDGSQRSTERPLTNKRKRTSTQKEDAMIEEAMSVLKAGKTRHNDVEKVFGQSVGLSLQGIEDKRSKELSKLKIREIIFQAQFGMLQQVQHPITLCPIPLQPSCIPQINTGLSYSSPLPSPHSPVLSTNTNPVSYQHHSFLLSHVQSPSSEHSPVYNNFS